MVKMFIFILGKKFKTIMNVLSIYHAHAMPKA